MNNQLDLINALCRRLRETDTIRIPETEEIVVKLVQFGGRVMVRHTSEGMVILFKSYEPTSEIRGRNP